MGFQIVQRHIVRKNVVRYGQPDGIGGVGLEVAMMNRQHFIEPAGNVKSHRPLVDKLVTTNFLLGHPPAFGAGKFEFVPVIFRGMGGQNRPYSWESHLADTRQLVDYLLMLEVQLFRVLNVLPFAAATGTKMFAKRLDPYRRPFMNLLGNGLPILFFLAGNPQIHDITGSDTGSTGWVFDKNYPFVGSYNAFSFGSYRINADTGYPDSILGLVLFMVSSAHVIP
jgi:hypothetical protein